MKKNEHNSMKLHFFQNQSSLKKFTFVLKTLLVFILSVLLVAPTPVLALVNTETLQDYAASVQPEINGLLQSIENLPSQSNDEAFKTLASIEDSLVRLSDNASGRAKEFQARSNEDQKELEKVTNNINTLYQEEQKLSSDIDNVTSQLASKRSLLESIQKAAQDLVQEYENKLEEYNRKTRGIDIEDLTAAIPVYGWYYAGKRIYEAVDAEFLSRLPAEIRQKQDAIEAAMKDMNKLKQEESEISLNLSQARGKIEELKDAQKKLEIEEKLLAQAVVNASTISLICNSLKPKLFLVKNRVGDVRDSGKHFQSFNNLKEELVELRNSVRKLADIRDYL